MTNQHQQSSNYKVRANSEVPHPEGRRRFVKGAAVGLPAVLTLHSGGLAALSLPCRLRPENAFEVEKNPNGSCALSGLPQ